MSFLKKLRAKSKNRNQLTKANLSLDLPFMTNLPVDTTTPVSNFYVQGYRTDEVRELDKKLYNPDDAENLRPILDEIKKHISKGDTEKLCIEIMRFATSSIVLGDPIVMKPVSKVIEDELCSCGGFSHVFCELARLAGVPARYLGTYGILDVGSHALAEAYYDGAWHLYDATFGVFFYSNKSYDGKGHILSGHEIVTQTNRPALMQVVHTPWQKNYEQQRTYRIQPVPEPATSHVLNYWGEKGRKNIFPICFGDRAALTFPIDIDLSKETRFAIGEPDNDWRFVWMMCIQKPRNGYFFIGSGGPKFHHYVRLKCPAFAHIKLSYIATSDSTAGLEIFPLADCFVLSRTETDNSTEFTISTNSDEPAFLLMCEGAFWIDCFSYEIIKKPE